MYEDDSKPVKERASRDGSDSGGSKPEGPADRNECAVGRVCLVLAREEDIDRRYGRFGFSGFAGNWTISRTQRDRSASRRPPVLALLERPGRGDDLSPWLEDWSVRTCRC